VRKLAIAVAVIVALALVAAVALGVSQGGRTTDGVNSFKLNNQAYAQAHIVGAANFPQDMQVRHLRNGVQIGGITNYPLFTNNYYNSTVSTGRACVNQFAYATWVSQARLVNRATGAVTAWDSGPGRSLLC
jgi:hypothetical protein